MPSLQPTAHAVVRRPGCNQSKSGGDMPRKIRKAARLARHRRTGVVVALLALGVLVEATGVLAGGSARTSAPAVSAGQGPVALAGATGRVYVGHSYQNDLSPALREIPAQPLRVNPEREAAVN